MLDGRFAPPWTTRISRATPEGMVRPSFWNVAGGLFQEFLPVGQPQHPQVRPFGQLADQPVDHRVSLPGTGGKFDKAGAGGWAYGECVQVLPRGPLVRERHSVIRNAGADDFDRRRWRGPCWPPCPRTGIRSRWTNTKKFRSCCMKFLVRRRACRNSTSSAFVRRLSRSARSRPSCAPATKSLSVETGTRGSHRSRNTSVTTSICFALSGAPERPPRGANQIFV